MRTTPLLLTMMTATLAAAGPAQAADEAWVGEARAVATAMPPKLLAVLTEEITKSGPEGAIDVCRDKAPQMAKAASEQSGWQIRRVSLRNRNPKAVPDAWERSALEEFDRRAAAGESPATLEKSDFVANGDKKEMRYMKALPVQQVCLACHGAPDQLTPEVTTQLRTLYPHDKAVGYALGQIRGAMTIRKAL